MEEKLKFGTGEREDLFHRFKDKYVVITPNLSGTNYGGLLEDEFDGFFILNPHVGRVYTDKDCIVKLIERDEYIRESAIQAIRETTKESLEGFCKAEDRNAKEEYKKQER